MTWKTVTVFGQPAAWEAGVGRFLAGLDFTIFPAGPRPEFYLLEPVSVTSNGERRMFCSAGSVVGRIIRQELAHPSSRNLCPVAATATCHRPGPTA
jgi:hypothetical protein